MQGARVRAGKPAKTLQKHACVCVAALEQTESHGIRAERGKGDG